MSVIDDLDARGAAFARALAHPTRHRLLAELGPDGATVSQLTNRLAINKGNVAHHMSVLLEAGLVRRGRSRTVRGGTEQYYVRAARRIKFEGGADGSATVAMMRNLTDELLGDRDALLNHRILRLTAVQAASLRRHLEEVVDALRPAADRERTYGVVVGLYRR